MAVSGKRMMKLI